MFEVVSQDRLSCADRSQIELTNNVRIFFLNSLNNVYYFSDWTRHGEVESAIQGQHIHYTVLSHKFVKSCEVVKIVSSLQIEKTAVERFVL